ncbi:hypothetical protein [Zwartia sp.]|uniref:hypothetical protein n=1 Tax=Zwartia sp. TaxID=2978004 RepID=UPI00271A596C|nr:hypothetical protein [Zwartia sp.]MDO9024970.1 hypothetical protein [Zwartia sp.]
MESLLALLPVLLIGSLGIELARGYQVRHLLTLALHETARVAAVHHGNPKHWQPQLNHSLSRLYLPPGRFTSAVHRMEAERHQFRQRYGQPMWKTEQIGTEAHTIHLRLTYLYRPLQPWLRAMLGKLFDAVPAWSGASAYSQAAWRQGLIPIVVEYQVLRHRSTTPTTF